MRQFTTTEAKHLAARIFNLVFSRRKREPLRPRGSEMDGRPICDAVPGEGRFGGGCSRNVRMTRWFRRLFPLPEGEGQGEGERNARTAHLPKDSRRQRKSVLWRYWRQHGSFPLTPALSLGEREHLRPRSIERDGSPSCGAVPGEGRVGGECPGKVRINDWSLRLFPLPEGEGQGEGERNARTAHLPENGRPERKSVFGRDLGTARFLSPHPGPLPRGEGAPSTAMPRDEWQYDL